MTETTYRRKNNDDAMTNGSRRKRRETEVTRIITEYKQGRGASSCMAEIIKIFEGK